jgi:Uma2 family endonuclease
MEIAFRLATRLAAALQELRQNGVELRVGNAFVEMGYRVGQNPDSWLRPDVSVTHQGQPGEDYFEGAPAVAVEIISDSNTAAQMDVKVEEYLSHGGLEVWLLYPQTRRAWRYRQRDRGAEMCAESLSSALLPGVSINLMELWL